MSAAIRPQYWCGKERRREQIRLSDLNGIDFLEVGDDPRELTVHFLQPLEPPAASAPPAPLTPEDVVVSGSADGQDVAVLDVRTDGRRLVVTLAGVGGAVAHELTIITPGTDGGVPAWLDTRLATAAFRFDAGCPTTADCAEAEEFPHAPGAQPVLDYLAKDYESFRALMLGRMATTVPDWTERHPADAMVALVETLAYLADHLSWTQDAVATEAHLGTARRRSSVRRHARLLDYRMSDGAGARTFLHLTATELPTGPTSVPVPAGTAVSPPGGTPVFETLHPITARSGNNEITLHTWSDDECRLPRGATHATLVAGTGTELAAGDLLLLEELATAAAPGDPEHRAVVRLTQVREETDRLDGTAVLEVAWDDRDALREAITVRVEGAVTAVARGNIALADHGALRPAAGLVEEVPAPPGPWRPLLPEGPLARRAPADPTAPATALLAVDPADTLPEVTLVHGTTTWTPVPDLLGAGPSDPVFVVETEDDGTARIRFGDDEYGRRPAPGTDFAVRLRVGCGLAGNLAPDAVDRLLPSLDGIDGVRNVVAATGGADPEPVERVRALAPAAFRTQARAVTTADYATVAAAVPGVQHAGATLRWTGSWYAAHVTVDRAGGRPLTEGDLRRDVLRALDRARTAGVDVAVREPVRVPVELSLDVCLDAGVDAGRAERELRRRLGSGLLAGGRRALFHPDALTLGQPVYLSAVHAAALEVAGVRFVRVVRFQRPDGNPADTLERGVLAAAPLEVLELGHLSLTLRGER